MMKSFQVTLNGIPYTAEFTDNGLVITDEDGETPEPAIKKKVHALAVRMVLHMKRMGVAGVRFTVK